jgi:hypothetical protein
LRNILSLSSLCLALLYNPAIAQPAQQTVAKAFPVPMSVVEHFTDKLATVETLVPTHSTLDDTPYLFQQIMFPNANIGGASVKALVEDLFAQVGQRCQQIRSKIVRETNQYVFYTIYSSGCKYHLDSYRTGKVFKGIDAIYVIRYTAKPGVSPQEISRWTHIIETAALITNPQL